tara:strand:+ start:208 stop:921 length:714 start_codon:yes stop_codon:yes gene_type:complete
MHIHDLLEARSSGSNGSAYDSDSDDEYDNNMDDVANADIPGGIYSKLIADGYKFLGAGAEQAAFLEPRTGLVLKIFGNRTGYHGMTGNQELFKKWANFCMLPGNKDNPFLPMFYGWTKFQYQNRTYLQIRCERLFPANPSYAVKGISFGNYLADLADAAEDEPYNDTVYKGQQQFNQLVLLVGGEEQFKLLWNTIHKIANFGRKNNMSLDLHNENFMLGSDGKPVINDPFYGHSFDY